MRIASLSAALVSASVMLGASCTTFNNARPLQPGQHAVMVTSGGPLADVPGIGTIPLPNVTVEGRSGIVEHLDVNYGTHLLPLVFGAAGAHVGAAWQLNEQPDAFGPALTVGERLYGFTNVIDGRKQTDFFAMSQTDLTASWRVLGEHLVYAGGTGYFSFNNGRVFLTPFAGAEIVPGVDWLRVQIEARYLAPYVNQRFAVVKWVAPSDQGGILINAGVAFVFGGGDP